MFAAITTRYRKGRRILTVRWESYLKAETSGVLVCQFNLHVRGGASVRDGLGKIIHAYTHKNTPGIIFTFYTVIIKYTSLVNLGEISA